MINPRLNGVVLCCAALQVAGGLIFSYIQFVWQAAMVYIQYKYMVSVCLCFAMRLRPCFTLIRGSSRLCADLAG